MKNTNCEAPSYLILFYHPLLWVTMYNGRYSPYSLLEVRRISLCKFSLFLAIIHYLMNIRLAIC